MHCLGLFLLQDMFLTLQVFAFEGQNYILAYGPAVIRIVGEHSDHGYHICPRRLFFGDAVPFPRESYAFV